MEQVARATRGRRKSLKEGVLQGVNLEASDLTELRRLAEERRTSVSAVIREAVRFYLWGHGRRRVEESTGSPVTGESAPDPAGERTRDGED